MGYISVNIYSMSSLAFCLHKFLAAWLMDANLALF